MASDDLSGLTIAVYARFSSDTQRDASIDDQIRRCRAFVEDRGGVVRDDLTFRDYAVSGAGADRPEYARLIALATSKPRLVDVIVVEDLSRLSRSAADLLTVQRLLEFCEVRIIGVADGIDTTAPHTKLTFGVKSIISDLYLAELGDKSRRGLEGRALAGFATGGVAFGYVLEKITNAQGGAIGSKIHVIDDEARIVRRIFALYLDGHSLAGIAKILNADAVPPPRVYAKRRRRGWKDTTIRAILRNESYRGVWTWGKRRWRKVPGTNKRRPTAGANPKTFVRPDLRIVDEDTWNAVRARISAVAAHFTAGKRRKPGERSVSGRATPYLFSSLLHCAACGSKMVISGGSSSAYYRCEGHSKRGVCKNALSVRENVVRSSLLDELRHRLSSDKGVAHARKRIAERLGEFAREQNTAVRERRSRLEKIERSIDKLIEFITAGNGTKAVSEKLKVLERDADTERRAIAALERTTAHPVQLPTPDEMIRLVFDLERRLTADVTRGREELRRLFRDGRIDLVPQPDGFYIARSEILPLVLLTRTPPEESPGGRHVESRYIPLGCAGRI